MYIAILKALADKIIPGVLENLRILLVGQVEGALSLVSNEDKPQSTVLVTPSEVNVSDIQSVHRKSWKRSK